MKPPEVVCPLGAFVFSISDTAGPLAKAGKVIDPVCGFLLENGGMS
jgi:hypothetical protein